MPHPRNAGYRRGENWQCCPVCGYEYRASDFRTRWDGLVVCKYDWEPRHPQDFLRPSTDDMTPAVSTGACCDDDNEVDLRPCVGFLVTAVETSSDTVELSVQPDHFYYDSMTVDYATVDGTAEAGTNYTATSGTLTWEPRENDIKTITISDIEGSFDSDVNFTVVLSDPTNATVCDGSGTATITIPEEIALCEDSSNYTSLLAGTYVWDIDVEGFAYLFSGWNTSTPTTITEDVVTNSGNNCNVEGTVVTADAAPIFMYPPATDSVGIINFTDANVAAPSTRLQMYGYPIVNQSEFLSGTFEIRVSVDGTPTGESVTVTVPNAVDDPDEPVGVFVLITFIRRQGEVLPDPSTVVIQQINGQFKFGGVTYDFEAPP